MFSGIHSLFFGKKHHHNHITTQDDSATDKTSTDDDFTIIERRRSDEPDISSSLYPALNPAFPSGGNLPYVVSPSLPDLRPLNIKNKEKEEKTIDLLHDVPFVLASYIEIMSDKKDEKFTKFLQRTKDVLTEDVISDGYNYDFDLENRILTEFET